MTKMLFYPLLPLVFQISNAEQDKQVRNKKKINKWKFFEFKKQKNLKKTKTFFK